MNPAEFLKKKEEVNTFTPLKSGWYELTFNGTETRIGQASGDEYENVEFKLNHNTGNRRCWLTIPFGTKSEKGQEFAKNLFSQMIYALGDKVQDGDLETGSLSETIFKFVTRNETIVAYLKQVDDRLEIVGFDKDQGNKEKVEYGFFGQERPKPPVKAPQKKAAGQDFDDFDDDVPF